MNGDDLTPPVIVCGVARSGTTFVQNLIDAHRDIAMSDEFFLYRMPTIEQLLTELGDAFPARRGDWPHRRAQIVRALWFGLSGEQRAAVGLSARRFGNKTPGAERYFDFYDQLFEVALPQYVYVLRRGADVFLSRANVRWGDRVPPIEKQLRWYKHSVAVMEEFRARHPERLHVVQVDRTGDTVEDRWKLVQGLFGFIGEIPDAGVGQFVEDWPRPQTSRAKVEQQGRDLVTELTEEQRRVLDADQDYQELLRRYGYASERYP